MASTVCSRERPLEDGTASFIQRPERKRVGRRRYIQKLGDNSGRRDLDENDMVEADAIERVE
jgi:hypothetical protein